MLRHASGRKAYKNFVLLSSALILLTSVGTGCGAPYNPKNGSNTSTYSVSDTGNGATTTTVAAATSGGQAPFKVKLQGNGYDTHSINVSTGTTLKVAFTPGKQNTSSGGKFYQYSMMAVYVGIGANIQPTQLVSNGLGGPAQISTTIDLSDFLPTKCTSNNPTCRQTVTITVTQPNNDDDCINSGINCPYGHVPAGHAWNGTLEIQTDDTSSI